MVCFGWCVFFFLDKDMEVIVTLQITAHPLLENVTVNGHFNHSGLHIRTQHNITLLGCCVQNNNSRRHKDKPPHSSSSKPNAVSHKPDTSEPGVFSVVSHGVAFSEGKNSSSHQSNRSHCLFYFQDIRRMSSKTGKRSLNTSAHFVWRWCFCKNIERLYQWWW